MTTLAEMWMERGVERGMERGMHKGELNNMRDVTKQYLSVKFSSQSSLLAKTIESIDDYGTLRVLFNKFILATSIEECEKIVAEICSETFLAWSYAPSAQGARRELHIGAPNQFMKGPRMPCRELHYSGPADWPAIEAWLAQRALPGQDVEGRVRDILDAVATQGDAALVDYTVRFDCPSFTAGDLRVPRSAFNAACAAVPAEDMAIIEEAADNIRAYHQSQVQHSTWSHQADGTILGRLVRPVDRAGLYVPGGQGGETPLISSLLMNAIPALTAGVPEIAVVSPPRRDGSLNPYILATAAMLGVHEVYCLGSAWAIAALAYGTATIPAVDIIAGPGNIYVTTAKRLLIGTVGIDMIAGPSEIAIVAQGPCDGFRPEPDWFAADMLSQAEHDALAAAICITTSPELAAAVRTSLARQLEILPRNEIAAKSLADWGAIVLVPDLATAYDLVNRLAPEHLELALADPWAALGAIRHAGAIFLGQNAPEPVGDYFAGPNHVLPTLGTARFSSGLSVDNFCKKSSLIATSASFIEQHAAKIGRFARLEGLEAHARSVECRRR